MSWFTKFCRNAGLMVHNIMKPSGADPQRREVNRQVEEKKVNDTVTLRRTTIDEVEVKRNNDTDENSTSG